jgi:hypothetical protein
LGQVGNPAEPLLQFEIENLELIFAVSRLGLEPFPFGDQLASLVRIFFLAGGLRHLVGPSSRVLDLLEHRLPLQFEGDDPVDLLDDVGSNVPIPAVLLDGFDIGQDIFEVEHAKSLAIRYLLNRKLGVEPGCRHPTCSDLSDLQDSIQAAFVPTAEVDPREIVTPDRYRTVSLAFDANVATDNQRIRVSELIGNVTRCGGKTLAMEGDKRRSRLGCCDRAPPARQVHVHQKILTSHSSDGSFPSHQLSGSPA